VSTEPAGNFTPTLSGKTGGVLAQFVRNVERIGAPEAPSPQRNHPLAIARHGNDRMVNHEDVERGPSGALLVNRFFLAL